ncbi:MucBP domain-containing protein [Enterococcus plantarum]|uniref:MucBP domain-containing protein n=1 Tax=Enterococcus plantarum TaxID=1077675 RepID=UPI001A8D8FC4|nr:MucBP domain-containing protein [Enterococcus plantarum]MBO0467493.1 MucBP domain-containing protein [Enterococcus plantarum]
MTKEKNLEKALTEEKYKCILVKSKKSWVIKGMLFSTLLVSGFAIQTNVYADNWTANNPESIQIESGATSYTLKNGDTLWAISQVTNIKVETLAKINNIDLNSGEQYSLEVGRVIYFDGNHITVKDKGGNIIADKVLDDNDKVDSSKPFANQDSDIPKNPVQSDNDGNVVNRQTNDSSKQNSNGNSGTQNNPSGNNQNGKSNQTDTGNNNSQEINKPSNPEKPVNPTEPSKPVDPEKPQVKEYSVSVIHKDNDGNILEKEAEVKVKKGESYTAKAKEFDGYTLTGQLSQNVKIDGDKEIIFTYRKNEKPNPSEKLDITIKYVDENNQEISASDTIKVEKGQEYIATAKTIQGYSLTSEATQTITVNKNETIIFKYQKNETPVEKFKITVKFEDEEGKEILSSEIHEIEKGQIFTAQRKDITGYTLIGDNTQSIMVASDKTITFKYSKNEEPVVKYPVTVEYRDEDGNLLSSDSAVEVETAKRFTATAKEINGYTIVGEKTQTITVNKSETIIFIYKKDEVPIIIDKSELENLINSVKETSKGNYTDESFENFTNALTNANSVLNNREATQPEVNEAKTNLQNAFEGLVEKEPEVVNYTVTVNHVTTDGTVLDTTNATAEEGKSFTANSKTFDGYTLQGASTQTITINGNTTITFTYAKDEVTPPVEQDVSAVEAQIASQALALINQHRNNNGLISLGNQSALQQGADVRSQEIFDLYEHTRPNREDGADAPYDYGYDQVVFCENIGMYNNSSSLEWLAQNGASIVVNAWINSPGHNANLLLDGLNEGSVGIHLQENGSGKYTMGSVFLGAKNYSLPTKNRSARESNEQTELKYNIQKDSVIEEVEPKAEDKENTVQKTEVSENNEEIANDEIIVKSPFEENEQEQTEIASKNKTELLEAYNIALTLEESNYSMHSWSTLMIKLADAKYVYDNPDASQLDIDNAVLALQQAINNLV